MVAKYMAGMMAQGMTLMLCVFIACAAISPDAAQARTISVREAARLQSFPDGFTFCGTMNPAFRQIGNAVPPQMAFCLAEVIHEDLVAAAKARGPALVEQRRCAAR